ncbi:S8 family serine peptidase [Actinomadura fulvescens]|uniref:Peptidase S8/S53 domain-containing protein n=1 Tax=Actinomadura fulvescens TaxID=46160 RepID=A0ABN3PJY9_9ACTN
MHRAGLAAAVALLTLAPAAVLAPASADSPSKPQAAPTPPPAPACDPPRGHRGAVGESWAQKRLGFERVWPLSRGQNVTVAVVDSGVEASHPMLAGRTPGSRVTDLTGTGKGDCTGHGTAVAALIAGRDMSDRLIPLSGVAPAADLYVVKHQNEERDQTGGERLPAAIRAAVAARAQVINISISAEHSPRLEAAVQFALRNDAVVVAAAGNVRKQDGEDGPAYPASYPGVISVASLGQDGARAESSGLRSKVDLAAPGKDVSTAWTRGGYNLQAQGTSFAAAYVSGVVALVRARHPGLNPQQVMHRLLVTADGNAGEGTGQGMVNPLQAVTALLPEEGSATPANASAPVRFAAPEPTDHRTRTIAIAVAGGALGVAALAAVSGIVLPLGRRRQWRPGRAVLRPEQTAESSEALGVDHGTIGR